MAGMTNLLGVAVNSYLRRREPLSLVHFVTNRCNARCLHCFIDFDAPDVFKGDLSLAEIQKLSRTVGRSIANVNLTGGEPFLREDLYEIAEAYFENAGVRSIYITSHGGFPDRIKTFLERFEASGIDGKIILSFSIDNFEQEHDENRRVAGLHKKTLESYRLVRDRNHPDVVANVAITVTDHNYHRVMDLYDDLKAQGVEAFSAIAMREEGVVKSIDEGMKRKIYDSYLALTQRIKEDLDKKETVGFKESVQGRIMNVKNNIIYGTLEKMYLDPHYISHCPAGALFGVIYANGDVYPCEVLEDRKLGNLREYEMDFQALWANDSTRDCKKFIKDTRCHCTYECAWSINVLSNFRYVPRLVGGVIKSYV